MGIRIDTISRSSFIFGSLLLMLVGLFCSRALLSISMIAFVTFCVVSKDLGMQTKKLFTDPTLLGMTLLFLIPLLSVLWSDDKKEWAAMLQIKLPLLLMPLSFAGSWSLSQKHWKALSFFFTLLLVLGCCWSLVQYVKDREALHLGYLQAKVIPTPLENDHVRYSWLVAAGIMNCSLLAWLYNERKLRITMILAGAFLTVYLHIISARTGLLSFYIFLVLAIVVLFMKASFRKAPYLLLVLVVLPITSWFLLPTFRNRIAYNLYDFSQVRNQEYNPGSNDGNRLLSIRAGLDILREHPWGVGTGDIRQETMNWYARQLPEMQPSDKLYLTSEWLVYGATAGWAGLLLFTIAMILPLFQKIPKARFFWIALNLTAAASFVFDMGLEIQFGVYIHTFLVLWWWKWLYSEGENAR